ncbi:MAG: TetR/AcrR family transcriptional regulator [Actinomycetota bacterium]
MSPDTRSIPSEAATAPRRRADAARNDQILWDTGLELLLEKGPDRLSALDLARSAGLTTGAVYARYENNEEILVGLWQNRIAGPLRSYLELAVKTMLAPPFTEVDAMKKLADIVLDPASPLRAGVSVLIAAPRVQELNEVIIPEMREWLHELGASDDVHDLPSLRVLSAASSAVGMLYFAAADMLPKDDIQRAVLATQYANQIEGLEKEVAKFPSVEATPPFNYIVTTGDPVRDSLVNAAARVVARSGVWRATTQRISRAAQLPPSALFATYQNRDALFEDVAVKLLEEIYNQSRYSAIHGVTGSETPGSEPATEFDDPRLKLFRLSMITSVAQNTMGLLGSIGKSHRRLRLEFQLAAIHDEDFKREIQRVDRRTVNAAGAFHRDVFGFEESLARRISRYLRTVAQGAMLLEEVTLMVDGRDIRLINARLADYASRRTIGEIAPTTPLG